MNNQNKGSVLSSVMITTLLASILVASVASLMNFQRKQALRQQLKLNSSNAAEAAIDYAYSFIVNDAEDKGLELCSYVPATGESPVEFTFPPTVLSFLKNKTTLPTSLGGGGDALAYKSIRVKVMPRPAGGPTRVYIDPKNPANENNPNRGQWVYQEAIPIIAAVTATQGGVESTTYVRKDLNYVLTNLFQHAIFYQGDLHLHRGFKTMGSVHTNGNMILNAHDGDHAIYNGFVSAGARFYRGSITDGGGTGMDAYGLVEHKTDGTLDPTKFSTGQSGTGTNVTTTTPLTGGGDIPIYVGADTDTSSSFTYRFVAQKFDLRYMADEDAWIKASADFNGHLQDKSHAVPIINPIGSIGYEQDLKSTTTKNEFQNGPYFLIEPLLPPTHNSRTTTINPKTNYRYNLSANASLVLRVEFAARDSEGKTWAERGIDPNVYSASIAGSGWIPMSGETPLPQAQNPANYIVRAYKKPAAMARADTPTDRVSIPFPTDVIGRADYMRYENNSGTRASAAYGSNYAYAAGADSQTIDVLGTECDLTAVTSTVPAARTNPGSKTSPRVIGEAWHRYRIEPYRAASSLPSYQTWPYNGSWGSTNAQYCNKVLPGIGIPNSGSGGYATDPQTTPAAISTAATIAYPLYGLHDSRLGRGVNLLTLDISRLKEIMEEPIANVKTKYGAEAEQFRLAFNNGAAEWNGIVYVEFPTSVTVDTSTLNRAPATSVFINNSQAPWDSNPATGGTTAGKSYLDTHPFTYGPAEKRIPYRSADTTTIADREDNIVPVAKELRRYPNTVNISTITNPANAIMALQVVNAKRLPRVAIVKGDANAQNTLRYGFTLATNAPLYVVGSWNADGDYTTGTKVLSTNPNDYATVDDTTLAGDANLEIPSAIFCDTITVLSPGFATQTNYPAANGNYTRRQYSYPGVSGESKTYREVKWKNASERIEISACIATGEFPVFEFFTHALEDFNLTNGTPCTPLVVKGAMVGMFTSELQHIKTAYGRAVTDDPQDSWAGHGAHCFPSPRLHKFILDGEFPPGTPQALVPTQSNFQILFKGTPTPNDWVEKAGF
ncbi:MAG: hypothetical protein QM715_19425 [Nibricoccus sp.]